MNNQTSEAFIGQNSTSQGFFGGRGGPGLAAGHSLYNQSQGYGNGLNQAAQIEPKEPGMRAKCVEIDRYLLEAHANLAEVRSKLFGEGGTSKDRPDNPAAEPAISQLLHRMSECAANLVGVTATIKSRL